jgi:hypothetical protein
MTSETAKTALDVSDLPEALQRVAHTARAVSDFDDGRAAEKERRDRAMAEAEAAGYTYRAIAAAARRGDGQATVSVVRNAVLLYG